VAVFDLGGGPRHRLFLSNLLGRGLVGRFDGSAMPETPAAPVDATPAAAEAVKRLLQARTVMSG
jgi:hypothetical protein